MHVEELPLSGRTALVTGVSRRRGIGFAVARELARLGASVVTHDFAPHDAEQPWGGDDLAAVAEGVGTRCGATRSPTGSARTCVTPPRSTGWSTPPGP